MPNASSYKKEILQEYEQIRFRNKQLLNQRIQEIRKQIPRIAEIDAQIRAISRRRCNTGGACSTITGFNSGKVRDSGKRRLSFRLFINDLHL